MRPVVRLAWALAASCFLSIGQAADLSGTRTITLHGNDGQSIEIGTVHIDPAAGGGHTFRVELDDERFENHFLSMRPFRCLSGEGRMLCHLAYPYVKPERIGPEDLVSLEYDLLFIRKSPAEYGIDPWNGVYYRLTPVPEGLDGVAMEVDLNILAAPPDAGELRPLRASDLHEADADTQWLPRMSIR